MELGELFGLEGQHVCVRRIARLPAPPLRPIPS